LPQVNRTCSRELEWTELTSLANYIQGQLQRACTEDAVTCLAHVYFDSH